MGRRREANDARFSRCEGGVVASRRIIRLTALLRLAIVGLLTLRRRRGICNDGFHRLPKLRPVNLSLRQPVRCCRALLVCIDSLVVVCDHDGPAGACTNYAACVVHHREVDIEASLLSVVPAVAGDAQGEYHGARGEIEYFRAVELDDARGVFYLSMT